MKRLFGIALIFICSFLVGCSNSNQFNSGNADIDASAAKTVILEEDEEIEAVEWVDDSKRCFRVKIQYSNEPSDAYQHKKDYFFWVGDDIKTIVVDYPKKGKMRADRHVFDDCDFRAKLEDVTFDGNDDLIIFLGNWEGENYYCAYIYDDGEFIYGKEFDEIPDYVVDSENGLILGSQLVDIASYSDYKYQYNSDTNCFDCIDTHFYVKFKDDLELWVSSEDLVDNSILHWDALDVDYRKEVKCKMVVGEDSFVQDFLDQHGASIKYKKLLEDLNGTKMHEYVLNNDDTVFVFEEGYDDYCITTCVYVDWQYANAYEEEYLGFAGYFPADDVPGYNWNKSIENECLIVDYYDCEDYFNDCGEKFYDSNGHLMYWDHYLTSGSKALFVVWKDDKVSMIVDIGGIPYGGDPEDEDIWVGQDVEIYKFEQPVRIEKLQKEENYDLYIKFLNGEIDANGITINDIVIPTGEPEKSYFAEYSFFDSDGDSTDELHIRSDKYYYIVGYKDEALFLWKSLYPQTELLNNGDFLYVHKGAAPLHYDYQYFVANDDGENILNISFSWYDDNGNNIVDEEDIFLDEDRNILSFEEWEELEDKYLKIGTDEILWTTIEK